MSGADAGPGAIGDFQAVGHQYRTLKDQFAAIAMCADVSLTDEQPTADIDRDLQALINDRETVSHLPDLNAAWARLGAAAEVGDAVTGSCSSPVGADPASGRRGADRAPGSSTSVVGLEFRSVLAREHYWHGGCD